MWMYLLSPDDSGPEPIDEIRALAALATRGVGVFLKLSTGNDPPLKGAVTGESVFFCTRNKRDWTIHAEAKLTAEAFRGPTPKAVVPIYGMTGNRHWWRELTDFRPFDPPLSGSALGLDPVLIPRNARARVVRVGQIRKPSSDAQAPEIDLNNRTNLGLAGRGETDIRTVGESSEDVIIDEEGRIFRLTGDQIKRPGHNPEIILRSLADAAAGRVISLDELRARRS